MPENIVIHGARMNNLKNIDVTIPREKLVVITGLSGSGQPFRWLKADSADRQKRRNTA